MGGFFLTTQVVPCVSRFSCEGLRHRYLNIHYGKKTREVWSDKRTPNQKPSQPECKIKMKSTGKQFDRPTNQCMLNLDIQSVTSLSPTFLIITGM
jgi:hypothetical protein